MRNLTQRILVAAVAIPALLWLSWNERFFPIVWAAIFIIMSWECWQMFARKKQGSPCRPYVMVAVSAGLALVGWWKIAFFFIGWAAVFGGMFAYRAFRGPTKNAVSELGSRLFGLMYAGLIFAAPAYLIRSYSNKQLLFWLLIFTWLVDTSAYTVGMLWGGKHRGITPASPNKSLEGFVGGFAVPLLLTGISYWIFPQKLPYSTLFLLAFVAGSVGQLGDLMESLVKRDMGVKDSSHLIPGHGGMLDRFDSFVVNAAVVYWVLTVFGKGRIF